MKVAWKITIEFLVADMCGPDEWLWTARARGVKLQGKSKTRDLAYNDSTMACQNYSAPVSRKPEKFLYEVEV